MTHAQTIESRSNDSDWSFILHDKLILISTIGWILTFVVLIGYLSLRPIVIGGNDGVARNEEERRRVFAQREKVEEKA